MKNLQNFKVTKISKLSHDEKKELIEAKVLDISREIFATRGFKSFSLEGLASLSGLSLKDITYIFPDEKSVYWKVFSEEARLFYDQLFLEIQGRENWMDTLKSMFYFSIRYMYQRPLARKIIFPFGIDSPVMGIKQSQFNKKAKTYELPVKQYLEQLFDRELFPGHSSLFVEVIFDFLRGIMAKLDEGQEIDVLLKETDYFLNLVM
ncbi:MAG: TetR/AcrR family transcriptional regulator [Aquificota bacterium]|nr:MAG: TetR/AcrR family transcriptional regulator [Aquificota bacterium]